MKSSYIKLIGPVVSLMLIAGNVLGQNTGGNTQGQQISALQITVSNLQAQVTELRSRLQYVSRVGTDMYITGANLHIRSGSGSTDGPTNGLGNLIVGYNELRFQLPGFPPIVNDRSGSHNIVLGAFQNFTSYGGFVAGQFNTIGGPYASVSGGAQNTAAGGASSVSGGQANTASGSFDSVSGGQLNTTSGGFTSVSGGFGNAASGDYSSVSGGQQNTNSVDFGWSAGGTFHNP
jgi:hypothetical protein